MAREYHCLVAGLPDLVIEDAKISSTILEFKNELIDNLHAVDYQIIKNLFLPYDHKNLIQYLFGEEEASKFLGSFSFADFEEQKRILESILKEEDILPNYMVDAMRKFFEEDVEYPKLALEKDLTQGYYLFVSQIKKPFFRNWFEFELNSLNIITAQNCVKYNIPFEQEIIGANELANTLRKSGVKDLSMVSGQDFYDDIIKLAEAPDYLEKEKKFDLIKWNYIDDNTFFQYFTIEKIAGYLLKLFIVNRWNTLDKEHGEQLFKKFINDLEKSYEFPEEFSVKK